MLKKSLVLLSIMVMGVITACSFTSQETKNVVTEGQTVQESNQESLPSEMQTVYPLTIQDDTGKEVTIPSEPKRIISLMPSHTETLFALGLEDRVIAVTKFDNYPVDIQEKVEYVFEDGLKPNIEQITNLQSDLVVLGSLNEELANQLINLKIPVVMFNPQNLEGVYQTFQALGTVTNTQLEAKKLIEQMQEKERIIEEKVAKISPEERVRVWLEVSINLWTAGKGTFLDELISKAGGINIVDQEDWIQYPEEKIIAANPQVILTTYSYYVPNPSEQIVAREGWGNIDAVKNRRIVDLDSDRVTRTGPRIIDGLEEIAEALYPGLLK